MTRRDFTASLLHRAIGVSVAALFMAQLGQLVLALAGQLLARGLRAGVTQRREVARDRGPGIAVAGAAAARRRGRQGGRGGEDG